jgi:2-keto-4-pentenoate hydratase/2-oxohepta-3-ene-1,7-dioic acid hydratase in catechol pathway
MKIIYTNTEHFRLIPDSALLLKNKPFFKPDYVKNLQAKMALVIKINRLGKYISEKFAPTYFEKIGFAIHFYDKTILEHQINKGFPWECATCFDGSFALSEFMKISEIPDDFELIFSKNNNKRILRGVYPDAGRTQDDNNPKSKIPSIISELSTFMTLKIGDYIAIELDDITSEPFEINDVLELFSNNKNIVRIVIK